MLPSLICELFFIPAYAADATVVNPNGVKNVLANGLSFSLKADQFLVMIEEVYLEILLIVLFWTVEISIVLYWLMNYSQKSWNLSLC